MNTLKLEAYFEFSDFVYLVTERLNTDMCQYIIKSPQKYLDEHRSRVLIYQVLVALRYLDTKNYGHLDIKCENILLGILKPAVNPNEKLIEETVKYDTDHVLVKLADFGYSQIIGENSFRQTRVGTVKECGFVCFMKFFNFFFSRNFTMLPRLTKDQYVTIDPWTCGVLALFFTQLYLVNCHTMRIMFSLLKKLLKIKITCLPIHYGTLYHEKQKS